MANVLNPESQRTVLNLLVEGNSLRSTSRLTGVHMTTIMNLMVRFGNSCRDFMDAEMKGLKLRHVQCDEIWTFVGKKQARLTVDEKATRHDIGDVYLWTAVDEDTKLIPTFVIGKRSADMARKLMNDLRSRLVIPSAHESDSHAFEQGRYQPVCQISTDGFPGYPEAVDLAFGPYVKYGTIIKNYRNATMIYTPSEIVGTDRRAVYGMDESETNTICTSHVERNNLTIRTFMKRFTRLSLGFSKKLDNLAAAVALHMAYYNFVWRPATLNGITPAMAAGVAKRLWNFSDLFNAIASQGIQG